MASQTGHQLWHAIQGRPAACIFRVGSKQVKHRQTEVVRNGPRQCSTVKDTHHVGAAPVEKVEVVVINKIWSVQNALGC